LSEPNAAFAVVLTTASSAEEAELIARALVERRLAACVNVTGEIRSIYRWEGKVCSESERLLVIKTTVARFAAVLDAIRGLHSYKNPEVVLLPISDGSDAYLRWILESVGEANGADSRPEP